MALATFGAGCFWGVEDLFRAIPGVSNVTVGYTGGTKVNPTYEDVCRGDTGHAEAVEVEFDPDKVSYKTLLITFFENHNPTTVNRQGPDVGSQYRSVIFTHDDSQKEEAERAVIELAPRFPQPIVTEITPSSVFYAAEEYHQQYLKKNELGSCYI